MQIDATHLVSLFENATEGIIWANGQGNMLHVNPAAEIIFGYPAGELMGNSIEVLVAEKPVENKRRKDHHF